MLIYIFLKSIAARQAVFWTEGMCRSSECRVADPRAFFSGSVFWLDPDPVVFAESGPDSVLTPGSRLTHLVLLGGCITIRIRLNPDLFFICPGFFFSTKNSDPVNLKPDPQPCVQRGRSKHHPSCVRKTRNDFYRSLNFEEEKSLMYVNKRSVLL